MREYLLVGEADGGICGHHVLTWGESAAGGISREPDEAVDLESSGEECTNIPDHAEQSARTEFCAEFTSGGSCAQEEQLWCALQSSSHDENI